VARCNAQVSGAFDAPVPCEGACPDITYQHYYAKGCEPVFDDEVDPCCPVSFNCTVAEKRSKDTCYYNGVAYARSEPMPIANPCEASCFCDKFSEWAQAQCAQVECPTLFVPELRACKQTNRIDSCCAELSDCPPGSGFDEVTTTSPDIDAEEAEATTIFSTRDDGTPEPELICSYQDKNYTDGQRFYPSNEPCRLCVCSDAYTGDIYGPSCRQIECGMDYRDRQELETGCTPIYFNRGCCQIDWICPDSDRLSPTPEQTATGEESPSTHCTLGSIVAPVNATVATTSDNLRCFCSTPPDFTCIQYSNAGDAQAAEAANARNVI